jgi:hypothetical protein
MATQSLGSAAVLNLLLWLGLIVSIPASGFQPVYATAAGSAQCSWPSSQPRSSPSPEAGAGPPNPSVAWRPASGAKATPHPDT